MSPRATPSSRPAGAYPDVTSAFGAYRPSKPISLLVAAAQRAPRSWLGQKSARALRKVVLRWSRLPLDLSVGPVKMRCYLRDNYSEEEFAFLPRSYDERERQALLDALPADGTFVDIGANVGVYSLTVATHLGAGGRIVALEPNPPAFDRLRFNVEATRAGRAAWPAVDLLMLGVADVPGEYELHLDSRNLGGSTIVAPEDGAEKDAARSPGTIRIACRPLLAILDESAVTNVDALKIDIEGAEDLALVPYLAQTPDARLPRVLVIENSEPLWKLDLVAALETRGYCVLVRSRTNTVYVRDGSAVSPGT